jgi:hypothetical protein
MSGNGPTRFRVPLPTDGRWPRAGKIRLGTAVRNDRKSEEFGRDIYTPRKADHYVVRVDESGITSEEAVRAFHAAYGDEPKVLRFLLVGETPDDVMEGAWRVYGANKLKRRCNGETCSERTSTGGWRDTACICKADNVAPTSRDHCTLTYQISLVLPDVAVPGIWQLDTGSDISSRNMAAWIDMIYELRGSLRGIEGDLRLVETKVAPAELKGKSSTVYVLKPEARGATVAQLLAGGGGRELGPGAGAALPPPSADETPELELDRSGHEAPAPETPTEATTAATADDAKPAGDASGAVAPEPDENRPLTVVEQIKELVSDAEQRTRIKRLAGEHMTRRLEPDADPTPIPTTPRSIALWITENHPGRDVAEVLDELEGVDQGRLV